MGLDARPKRQIRRILAATVIAAGTAIAFQTIHQLSNAPKDASASPNGSSRVRQDEHKTALPAAMAARTKNTGAGSGAGPKSSPLRVMIRNWLIILSVILGVGTTALAWLAYRAATPPVPESAFQGAIATYVYGNVTSGSVRVDIDNPKAPNPRLFVTTSVQAPSHRTDVCLPYAIVLAGDAEISNNFLGTPYPQLYSPRERVILQAFGAAPMVRVQMWKEALCTKDPFFDPTNHTFSNTTTAYLKHPIAAQAGPLTSYRLPIVFPLQRSLENIIISQPENFVQEAYPPDVYNVGPGADPPITYDVPQSSQQVSAGEMPPDTRIDASAPVPAGSTNMLSWESSQKLAPSATLANIPGEQQASRWLFWSGVLAGAAVSAWLWALQIWASSRRKEETGLTD